MRSPRTVKKIVYRVRLIGSNTCDWSGRYYLECHVKKITLPVGYEFVRILCEETLEGDEEWLSKH